jgi:hypothetical protein
MLSSLYRYNDGIPQSNMAERHMLIQFSYIMMLGSIEMGANIVCSSICDFQNSKLVLVVFYVFGTDTV